MRTTRFVNPDNAGGLGFEREIDTVSGTTIQTNRHYLSVNGEAIGMLASTGAVPTLTAGALTVPSISSIALNKVEYWHKDFQGSIAATTDQAGTLTAAYAYDPFGKRRYTDGNYDAAGNIVVDWSDTTNAGTGRGYTGHQQLDDIGLVHMNGRIYDPNVSRMLQADPDVTDITNLQNTNRYSYVLNNPMSWTDPTGYEFYATGSNIGFDTQSAADNFFQGMGGSYAFQSGGFRSAIAAEQANAALNTLFGQNFANGLTCSTGAGAAGQSSSKDDFNILLAPSKVAGGVQEKTTKGIVTAGPVVEVGSNAGTGEGSTTTTYIHRVLTVGAFAPSFFGLRVYSCRCRGLLGARRHP